MVEFKRIPMACLFPRLRFGFQTPPSPDRASNAGILHAAATPGQAPGGKSTCQKGGAKPKGEWTLPFEYRRVVGSHEERCVVGSQRAKAERKQSTCQTPLSTSNKPLQKIVSSNSTELQSYLARLREHLYISQYTRSAWDEVCDILDECLASTFDLSSIQDYIAHLDSWPCEVRHTTFDTDISSDIGVQGHQLWWSYMATMELLLNPPRLHRSTAYQAVQYVIVHNKEEPPSVTLVREMTRRMPRLQNVAIHSGAQDFEPAWCQIPGWQWVSDNRHVLLQRNLEQIRRWFEAINTRIIISDTSLRAAHNWNGGNTRLKAHWFAQAPPTIHQTPEASALRLAREVLTSDEAVLYTKSPPWENDERVALTMIRRDFHVIVELSANTTGVEKMHVTRTDTVLQRSCFVRVGVVGALKEAISHE